RLRPRARAHPRRNRISLEPPLRGQRPLHHCERRSLVEERRAAVSESLELEAIDIASFGCSPQLQDGKLTVSFTGIGDVAASEPLAGYLKRVHAEAERLAVSQVTCDFRKLSFMNSSCFKAC